MRHHCPIAASSRLKQRATAVTLVLCGFHTTTAIAQESTVAKDNTAAEVTAQKENPAMEEVIVRGSYTTDDQLNSATGLGLSIKETPQSVSVMTFQRIEDQNLNSLTDVVLNATGVSAKELDSSRSTFAARGFEIDNYQLDGVPISWSPGGDAGETQTDMAAYERIEIVRGATGLLTGAGNPSASINLVRKHADSKELTGVTSVGASRWNNYEAMADVSTPITSDGSIRARAVLSYADGDSWTDLLGNTKKLAYGTMDADLGVSTLFRVGASYQDNDPTSSTWGGLPAWFSDGSRTDWPDSKTVGADWTRWASTSTTYFATLRHEFLNKWSASLDYNRAENDANLHLLYLSGAPDKATGEGMSTSPYRSDTTREQDSIGVNVSGSYALLGREHEAVVGYSWMDQNEKTHTFDPLGESPGVGNFFDWDGSYPEPQWGDRNTDIELDTEQTGFYAATRVSLTDALKLVLGGRLASWESKGQSYGASVDYQDSNVFLPYVGALYDITESTSAYLSYTEIFKPQNALDRNGQQLDPIIGESYEIGLKSGFFNDSLSTTVAVFHIKQDNLAQIDTGNFIPGTIFEASRAAEGATSEGFELEAVGAITEGWEIAASYTQFKAQDANNVNVNTSQPRKMFKLFTTYHAFTGILSDLTIGGGINWQGENYTPALNPTTGAEENLVQDDYSLVNLMARYDFSEQLSAQININNLLDKTYYSQIGFYSQLAYGSPFDVSAELRYRF
ncbi:FhuE receptor [Halioglobus japonicus]|nr:FhuE receptor [Halioglobus japonicus]